MCNTVRVESFGNVLFSVTLVGRNFTNYCLKFKTPIIMHYEFTSNSPGRPAAFGLSNATAFVNWLFHNHDSNNMIQVQHALIYILVHVHHTTRPPPRSTTRLMYVIAACTF